MTSLLKAMSAKQRSKCSPVAGNGESRRIAEKLPRGLQTNKQKIEIMSHPICAKELLSRKK
jgi:hypothetical protein